VLAEGDDALMERVRARDQAAFNHLLARHLSAIHGYLLRLTRSPADADELAQETFLRVWSRADTYRPGTVQLTTWLHRIAHNLCMDQLRRVRPESLDDADEHDSELAGPEDAAAASETAARLSRALDALPPTQCAALLLTEVQGLSNQQVADIMNLGVRAVESLLARARRTLRERILEP
jgi:RNA polymerase sigma-70 factor (ECF subfamily)